MPTPSLIKQPAESRLFSMDFSALLAPGETITSVVSVAADQTGLDLTATPTASAALANMRIAGGTSGTAYRLTFVVGTSAGNTLEGEGILQVKDL